MFKINNKDYMEYLENKIKKFIVHNPGINMKQGEICYFQCDANAVNIKNVVVGSQRNSTYISSRNMGLGAGFSGTSNIRGNVAEKYPGYLYITNQRIILNAIKYGFEIPLTQITTMNFMSDSFWVMSKGKTHIIETPKVNKIKKLIKLNNEYLTLKNKNTNLDNEKELLDSVKQNTERNNDEKLNQETKTEKSDETLKKMSDFKNDMIHLIDGAITKGTDITKDLNAKIRSKMEEKNRNKMKEDTDENNTMKSALYFFAVIIGLFMIASFFATVNFNASPKDIFLYRLAGGGMLAIWELGILLELNIFNLKERTPLIKSESKIKHILFAFIVLIVGTCFFSILYGMTSDEFKENVKTSSVDENDKILEENSSSENSTNILEGVQTFSGNSIEEDIVKENEKITWEKLSNDKTRYKEILMLVGNYFPTAIDDSVMAEKIKDDEKYLITSLYEYYTINSELPTDFKETFTNFCVGEEYDDMYLKGEENNEFFEAVSKGFQISWSAYDTFYIGVKPKKTENVDRTNQVISDEEPLIFNIDGNKHNVGNCTFSIDEVQVASIPFKTNSRSVYFRVYGTVKNNTGEVTYFNTTNTGNWVGTYYGEKEYKIGGNTLCRWANDKGQNEFSTGYKLAPYEERQIKMQATYTTTEIPTYDYKLNMDLYFRCDDNLYTLTIKSDAENK